MSELEVCPICSRRVEDMRHVGVECFYQVDEVVPRMEPTPIFVEVSADTAIWGITRTYPAGTRDHHTAVSTGPHSSRIVIDQLPIDGVRLAENRMFSIRCCKDCRADFLNVLKRWADGEEIREREGTGTGAFVRDNGTIRELTEDECLAFEKERGHPPVRVRQEMDLTFTQFAERVYAIAKDSLKKFKHQSQWPYEKEIPITDVKDIDRGTRLEGERIHVGGISGGSCWDTGEENKHRGYTTTHGDIEIDCLEAVLADICPQITFLQYKRLAREMKAETLETSHNEYYGNSSNYQQKVVKMGDLYDALVTVGVIAE